MKSNTKTLLAIGLVLLVITIGISFSYFVSKTTQNNLEDVNTQAPTAKIPEFKLETNVDTPESLPIYPGTKNYISASVKGIKTGGEEDDTTQYQIKYRITGSVSVTGEAFTQGSVTYKLYKTTEKIEKPIVCSDVTGTQGGKDKETEVHYTQECELDKRLSSPVTLTTDEHNGSIKEGTAKFSYEDVIPADNKTTHHYYLVVEYPNEEKDQSDDMGKSITYSINSIISTETSEYIPESKKTFDVLASLACLESELKSEGVIDKNGFTDVETGSSSCKVYEAVDNDGTSYYYRGDVQDNYVKFGKMGGADNQGADIWWRIIRINGDGSIRMIYAGTGENVPDQKSASTNALSLKSFNSTDNENKYVGYQYSDNIRNGHEINSTALNELIKWFEENLLDEFETSNSKIDTNAGFCGDRTSYERKGDYPNYTYEPNDKLGLSTQKTYYGSSLRNYPNENDIGINNPAKPTYKCEDEENDLYTYSGASKGTKSLTYPIGLITADEVTYAGGLYWESNASYYLNNNTYYWAFSPTWFDSPYACVFYVHESGALLKDLASGQFGLRPVINLKSGSLVSGNGTSTEPFLTSN